MLEVILHLTHLNQLAWEETSGLDLSCCWRVSLQGTVLSVSVRLSYGKMSQQLNFCPVTYARTLKITLHTCSPLPPLPVMLPPPCCTAPEPSIPKLHSLCLLSGGFLS